MNKVDGKHEKEAQYERVSHNSKTYIQRERKREKRRVFRSEARSNRDSGYRALADS